jgi:hypothetical protein
MAISQPVATDKLNSPDHSLMHRQIATDPSTPVQSLTIDATGAATLTCTGPAATTLTLVNNIATSGGCLAIVSTTGSIGPRVLTISNGSAAATGAIALQIVQSAAGAALHIDYNTTVSDLITGIHIDGCAVAVGTAACVLTAKAPDGVGTDTISGWLVVKIDGGANNAYIPYWM